MDLPRIIINIPKIVHNFERLSEYCRRRGVALNTVVKGIAGDFRIVEALAAAGMKELGDSRIENLKLYSVLPRVNRVLLRLPSISKLEKVVQFAGTSLNSEPGTIAALDDIGGNHQIMLMMDLGDRREGVLENEIFQLAGFCSKLKHAEVTGVGANFSCFAGVKPTKAKLNSLIEIAALLKEEFHLPIRYVSGGNSSSLPLLYSNNLPEGINHLRVGEGILLGRETLTGEALPDLYSDAFIIEAEVLQSRWKPALAGGEIGRDAFGRKPEIPEVPDGYRLLINLGQQDTPLSGLVSLEPGIQILGGSSDYLVLAGREQYKVGTIIRFLPSYWGLLAIMTSPYVEKEYIY
jgi:predicted amino acid racemase